METDYRPLQAESVCRDFQVSHGNTSVSPQVGQAGGLDDNSGLEGCLPSDSNSSRVQEVPEIQFQQQHLSVQGSVFRPLKCPSSLHQGHGSGVGYNASSRLQDSSILGRLVGDGVLVRRSGQGEGLSDVSVHQSRHSNQSGEEQSSSCSICDLFEEDDTFSSFEGFHDLETGKAAVST